MEELKDRAAFFGGCRRLVIKVGSAVLTDSRGLNRVMIHRLSDQIAELRQGDPDRKIAVVSSGAVASGFRKVGFTEPPRTIPHKQAMAAVGQGVLMEAWEAAFDKYDLLVAQVLLTSEDLSHRHRYLNARNTLETLLDWGILPIINENDTVVVEEIRFGDNDHLSAMIAGLIGADLVIILTDTAGLYDCDPRFHEEARLIPLVHRIDSKLTACATPVPGSVGTGGMLSKINAAKKCLASGIPLIIAPGRERDVLLRIFAGEDLGTVFLIMVRNFGWQTFPNRWGNWCSMAAPSRLSKSAASHSFPLAFGRFEERSESGLRSDVSTKRVKSSALVCATISRGRLNSSKDGILRKSKNLLATSIQTK
jgi:glutamate 5-kinase